MLAIAVMFGLGVYTYNKELLDLATQDVWKCIRDEHVMR